MNHGAPDQNLPDTLRRAAAGDADAWRSLVGAYSGRMYGLLLRQCGDRDLAEELTQATFVKLVVKLGDTTSYEERGRFEAWLFRMAINELRDEMRRRKRHARPMDMGPGSGSDGEPSGWAGVEPTVRSMGSPTASPRDDRPDEQASRAETVAQLTEAVDQLNDADREVLHLRHTAGLSFAEIAESLGQPLGTVLARAHRALGKLRKIMEHEEQA
ncbi:RNA polymerase sigma factor [Phycisphaerales bacterium AB-hyl4]|uniref:RNA polymerase sigma factor n=1 Tax=Natronomicrosphaera hydrolytica TaxID=3242702 RepID=A0ABV4U9D1_9BACT